MRFTMSMSMFKGRLSLLLVMDLQTFQAKAVPSWENDRLPRKHTLSVSRVLSK